MQFSPILYLKVSNLLSYHTKLNKSVSYPEVDTVLVDGLGDYWLLGGSGSDTFALELNAGTDTIADFTVGQDVIGLSDGLTFEELQFSGSSILLSADQTTLATLTGVDATLLNPGDFVAL